MVDAASSAERQVDELIEGIRARTLRRIRPYVLVGALPTIWASLAELERGHVDSFVIAYPLVVGVMVAAFWALRSSRALRMVICVGLPLSATAGLLHFGPLIGIGLLFALSVLAVVFLFGRPAMFATAGYLTLLLLGTAVWATHGRTPPWWGSPLAPAIWGRLVASTTWMLAAIGLVFDGVQASMRDAITNEVAARLKQVEAEQQREGALAGAMKAQHLEMLGELSAGVAHDINNMLVVVQGALEALATASPSEREQIVEEGLGAVRNGSQTARRLLGLARKSSGEVGHCEPVAVIEATVRVIQRVLPESVAVDFEKRPSPEAAISAGALEQIVLNLVVNARDAMAGHGKIVIRCGAEGDRACVEVIDDGPGMSDAVRARVFEPFFTTKARGEGTGLGLAMVHRLVHNASGTIELETEVGRGTRFIIRLPGHHPTRADEPPDVPTPPRAAGAHILVVEDEPQVRRVFERILGRAGYVVTALATVGESRSQLRDARFDLLITDGQLPDGNAAAVMQAYQVHHAGGPVIVCTGYVDDAGLIAQLGGDAAPVLVQKPFQHGELLALVARLLATSSLRPEPLPVAPMKVRP